MKYFNIDTAYFDYYYEYDDLKTIMKNLHVFARNNGFYLRVIMRQMEERRSTVVMQFADQVLVMDDGYWRVMKCREGLEQCHYLNTDLSDFDDPSLLKRKGHPCPAYL